MNIAQEKELYMRPTVVLPIQKPLVIAGGTEHRGHVDVIDPRIKGTTVVIFPINYAPAE